LPADAGLEYPESDIEGICPEGWRLPTESEFVNLKTAFPETSTLDDFFAATFRRPIYSIHEEDTPGREQGYATDVEEFFYPTDVFGLNFSTLTRHYYDSECSEESSEKFAFSSYWTSDSKEIPLWPDEDGNVEVKQLRFYRFGGTDYCEAMLCREDFHFVRCVME
jgi:uncharacterized protein (TIGR02145 family)